VTSLTVVIYQLDSSEPGAQAAATVCIVSSLAPHPGHSTCDNEHRCGGKIFILLEIKRQFQRLEVTFHQVRIALQWVTDDLQVLAFRGPIF